MSFASPSHSLRSSASIGFALPRLLNVSAYGVIGLGFYVVHIFLSYAQSTEHPKPYAPPLRRSTPVERQLSVRGTIY